jgi:RAT1-interacting protein
LTESGYKFEAISLLDQPWDPTPREEIEAREELVVNNNAQYCSIVRTGIGKTRLIIGGEVDAGMKDDRFKLPLQMLMIW